MRLEKLEALRGFAALYVVLHHTISHSTMLYGFNIGILLRFGQEAVILFFLLSGFVINYSFQTGSDKSFSRYFSKRFLRIFIPLLVVFVAAYLSESYNNGGLLNPDLGNLVKNLFMLQDWGVVKPNVLAEPYMGNTPLWSLSYEWWFYMLYFPLVTYIKQRKTRNIIVFSVCFLAAISYVYYPFFVNRLLAYLVIWWAGVQLSDMYLDRNLTVRSVVWPLCSLAVIGCVLVIAVFIFRRGGGDLMLGFHPLLEFRHVVSAGVMIVVGFVWHQAGWWGFNVMFRPFLWLAPISYALYICHINLMVNATYLDWIGNPIVEWFAYFACLIIFSAIVELKVYPAVRNYVLYRRSGSAGVS